jgi:signal transduction histidine kinase/DNA-binding response OmpR family regulator/putative methionine-R-sulfoxide reductase with GAF domain
MLVEVKGTSFDFNLAQNLSEGLEQLETQDVDIILLDLSLPDSAGIHTFEQVHTKAPQVPVIILSGITDETVAVNTVRAGAQDYLIKGKTDSELLARAIKYAIERKQAETRQAYYLQTEHALRQISSSLVDPKDLDQAINDTLTQTGTVLCIDRACLVKINEDENRLSVTHEWTAEEIPLWTAKLKDQDTANFPGWMRALGNNDVITISDISQAPSPEKELFQELDVYSILVIPIYARGALYGFLGLAATKQYRDWKEEDVRFTRNAAEILARAIERIQTERYLQQRNLELATLNAVAQALSSSLELKDLLDEALSRTTLALGFLGGLISLEDALTGALVPISYTGIATPLAEKFMAQGAHCSACELVYESQKTVCLESIRQDAKVQMRELLDAGIHSYIGAPIVHKDHVLGILCLFSTIPHPITETEHEILNTIGQQIGVAVENARLFSDVTRERQIAQTLLDTTEALNKTLQLDKLLEGALDELQCMVPYDAATISLIQNEKLWIVASRGLEQSNRRTFTLEERPLIQKIIDKQSPIIISNVSKEPAWAPMETVKPDVRSWMGVPLIAKERIIGVLMIDSHQLNTYDKEMSRLTLAFAHQAALAIDNSRLYEQTRAQLHEAVLLQGVTATLASTLDIEQILPYIARSLCEALNTTNTEIYRLDQNTQTMTVIAQYVSSETTPAEQADPVEQVYSLQDLGLANWSQSEQINLDDPPSEQAKALLRAHKAQAALLLPIIARGYMTGLAITWEIQGPRRFTEGEIALGQTLTHQAAITLENAYLFKEVEASRIEIEQRAKALAEANVRLQELDRLKSQFLAHMSHELRTPLNSIIGFSEILADGLLGEMPPAQLECAENILTSGEHLLVLINNILDLSKIEAGRMTLELATFNIEEWFKDIKKTLEPLVEKKSQTLTIHIAADLPQLTADPLRLKQVLINLLSNANKFTAENGNITLSCELVDPDTIIFSVADTGIGIKPQDYDLIFEEFQQSSESGAGETQGSGLGLAICKRLIEMHRGVIWVESEYGNGTVFSFLLPLNQAPQDKKGTPQSNQHPKVLVIDGDRRFSNILALYLRQDGYEPIQYYTGANVLERVLEVKPDVITLDINLPDQGGLEIIDALKTHPLTRDIPTLVISETKMGELALDMGATDYLVKPILHEELSELLCKSLTREKEDQMIKILVVDDDKDISILLREMLPTDHYEMLTARDGAQGFEVASREYPDIILLDLMMPNKSGFDMLKRLQADAQTAHIPVIVLTAIDVTSEQQRFLNDTTVGIMRKTRLTPQALLDELHRLEKKS